MKLAEFQLRLCQCLAHMTTVSAEDDTQQALERHGRPWSVGNVQLVKSRCKQPFPISQIYDHGYPVETSDCTSFVRQIQVPFMGKTQLQFVRFEGKPQQSNEISFIIFCPFVSCIISQM